MVDFLDALPAVVLSGAVVVSGGALAVSKGLRRIYNAGCKSGSQTYRSHVESVFANADVHKIRGQNVERCGERTYNVAEILDIAQDRMEKEGG